MRGDATTEPGIARIPFTRDYNPQFAVMRIAARLREIAILAGYHSKPAFLIIGAQKAGTTALYYYLADHPQILPAREKEVGFFVPELVADWPEHPNHHILCTPSGTAFDDPRSYRTAAAWYHRHFPLPHELGRERLTFEATPEYLYYPRAAERIFRYEPRMKLVALVRDPVERAFSAWNMYRNFGDYRPWIYAPRKEVRDFDLAVREEIDEIVCNETKNGPGYVRRGLYYDQLVRYFELFDRRQIVVLHAEDLRANTRTVLNDVLRFLGLPEYSHRREWEPMLVGRYEQLIPDSSLRLLREFYRPHNAKLYQLLDRDFGW